VKLRSDYRSHVSILVLQLSLQN